MQVNKQNVLCSSLIDYSSTIDCTTNSSNIVHKKNVTSDSHNIKKSLKSKNPQSRNDISSLM